MDGPQPAPIAEVQGGPARRVVLREAVSPAALPAQTAGPGTDALLPCAPCSAPADGSSSLTPHAITPGLPHHPGRRWSPRSIAVASGQPRCGTGAPVSPIPNPTIPSADGGPPRCAAPPVGPLSRHHRSSLARQPCHLPTDAFGQAPGPNHDRRHPTAKSPLQAPGPGRKRCDTRVQGLGAVPFWEFFGPC